VLGCWKILHKNNSNALTVDTFLLPLQTPKCEKFNILKEKITFKGTLVTLP
jgi:hypothetical protein